MVPKPVRHWRELSLRPRFGVPRALRLHFVPAAVAAFVTFALDRVLCRADPEPACRAASRKETLVSGAIVFALFMVAAFATMLARNIESRAAMLGGSLCFPHVSLSWSGRSCHGPCCFY